ncbi:glycoside hydrolase family 3 N-terminal domain-containing protein [Candidatus Kapabacteria bacterium]|nr:glycoside hydrolase family 3 N-terminal domain-containing protein [Candidatus Kapabacteria bacterium]
MTDKQIASYCVFPRLNLDKFISDELYATKIIELVKSGVGGFCIFGKVKLDDVQKVINGLQNIAKEKLLFSADFEFGLPMRLLEGTAFPHAMALGKTGDEKSAFYAAQLIGRESKEIGIDWIFAPVCDINSNKNNPIINIRSFGENEEIVGKFAAAFALGLHESGIISTAKHFPGHGDTDLDSHLELPVVNGSKERLENLELKPFKKLIKNGVKSIMLGHLAVPAFDTSLTPASLSKPIIQDLLIKELGFDGIIISDALEMKSISNNYSSGLASELSLRAGNHIALIPEDASEAISHLESIIKNDLDFKNELIAKAEKIRELIKWTDSRPIPKVDGLRKDRFLQHEKFALQIARKTIEIRAPKILTPIDNKKQVAAFAFLQSDSSFPNASMFFNLLQSATENDIDFGFVNHELKEDDLVALRSGITESDVVIFANFYKSHAYSGNIGFADKLGEIQHRLAGGIPRINLFFGNPYLDDQLRSDMSVKAFSDSLCSLASVVMLLTGRELGEDGEDATKQNYSK